MAVLGPCCPAPWFPQALAEDLSKGRQLLAAAGSLQLLASQQGENDSQWGDLSSVAQKYLETAGKTP